MILEAHFKADGKEKSKVKLRDKKSFGQIIMD